MAIVENILAVVRHVAERFVPGASDIEHAAASVIDLVRSIGPTLSSEDQAELAEGLEPLLAKMNADVDAAVRALRGDGAK